MIKAVLAAATLPCLGAVAAEAAATTAPVSSASAPCAGANLSPTATDSRTVDAATLCLIDKVRIAHHLRPLRPNHELRMLAASQVDHMVSWNYFSDDRPPGLTPFSLASTTRYPAHARHVSVGENIGWGTGEYATPARMVAGWMASPAHRENILARGYRDAGVGITPAVPPLVGPQIPGATYAIEFGARRF